MALRISLEESQREKTVSSIDEELKTAERLLRLRSPKVNAQVRIEAAATEHGRQQHLLRQQNDQALFVSQELKGLAEIERQLSSNRKIESGLVGEQETVFGKKRSLDTEASTLTETRARVTRERTVLIEASEGVLSRVQEIRSRAVNRDTKTLTIARLRKEAPEHASSANILLKRCSEIQTLLRSVNDRKEDYKRLQLAKSHLEKIVADTRALKVDAIESQVATAERLHAKTLQSLESAVEPLRRLQAAAQEMLRHTDDGSHLCPLCSHDWLNQTRLRKAIEGSIREVPEFVTRLEAERNAAAKTLRAASAALREAQKALRERDKLREEVTNLEKSIRGYEARLKAVGVDVAKTSEYAGPLNTILRRLELAITLIEFDEEIATRQSAFDVVPRTLAIVESTTLDEAESSARKLKELAGERRKSEVAAIERMKAIDAETSKLNARLSDIDKRLAQCRASIADATAKKQRIASVWERLSRNELSSDSVSGFIAQLQDGLQQLGSVAEHLAAARNALQFETRRSDLNKLEKRLTGLSSRRDLLQKQLDAAQRAGAAFREQYTTLSRQQVDALSEIVNPLFARMHANRIFDSLDLGDSENFLHWVADAGDQELDPKTDFSQGQRQDLALALFIARARSLGGTFFLDEPISHLDDLNRVGLLDAIGAAISSWGMRTHKRLRCIHGVHHAAAGIDRQADTKHHNASFIGHQLASATKESRIRELNDVFRRTFVGGAIIITPGIEALAPPTRSELLHKVRGYDQFDARNDPHGEHDFGSLEIAGKDIFWKIDYYDRDAQFGSEDPSDPTKTTRILTIMLASEY